MFLITAYIVGTTLSKAAIDRLLYQSEFDMVVVDEISMVHTRKLLLQLR